MYRARKSSLFGKITVFFVICCYCLSAQAEYGGGSGTANDPYLIYTAEQMNAIGADSNDWSRHFKLMADIDLSAYTGTSFNVIGIKSIPFTGVFDGNGHSISNFTYTSTGTYYIGIFGYIKGGDAQIRDLRLIDAEVHAGTGSYVGSLVGWLNGTITDCSSNGSVSGNNYIGGLVGMNIGIIIRCNSIGEITGYERVGGLVGQNGGTITNCYSTAIVTGYYRVGALVGWNSGTISNCYSGGDVSGFRSVGGLVGYNGVSKITNSYSFAGVTGDFRVGGLVGRNYGTITNCYSTGNVVGDNPFIGGLVGAQEYGTVVRCFWDIQTSGQTTSGGGTGKTTDQMQDVNTFLYWGACGNGGVWTIDDGHDYPRLAWQNLPGVSIEKYEPVYGGGSGTMADPYQIWTAEQLNTIGQVLCHWDKHFLLCADIDLSDYTGRSFNIIGSDYLHPFKGIFDGKGHTISNFKYKFTRQENTGLFGYVDGNHAGIKDLRLIDPHVDAGVPSWCVGSLVGCLFNGIVTGCCVEGGSIEGYRYVGGLVGLNEHGTITNCSSNGSVMGESRVGGMVGRSSYGTITNCCSIGSVLGESQIGGLVGSNLGNVSNCYSEAGVSGTAEVGGLVGDNGGPITNCYSTGSISGNHEVGGLVGNGSSRRVTNSFWDIETSGQITSAGGTGLPTVQMQMAITFIGWGCGWSVWTIDEGKDYPRLWWENMPGENITLPSYGGGSGEPNDPYLIYTAEQLNTIGLVPCHLGKHFKLMADIDMGGFIGMNFNIIGADGDNPFTGTFDGNYHAISNFTCDSNDKDYVGMFGYIENGRIRNLGLIDAEVDAGTGDYVGSLVGKIDNGTITNCYVKDGSVSGYERIGGLVGYSGGTINDCYSTASITGYHYAGGLVGRNGGSVNNSYSTGSVFGETRIGGLVGHNERGTITNCYSTGSIKGEWLIGGLVGSNSGKGIISNCYSSGSVSGEAVDAGGLVGRNNGIISNCSSTVGVSGNERVGGLVGLNSSALITNCYSTAGVWGNESVGGLVGYNSGTITNCRSTGSVGGDYYVGGLVGKNNDTITNCYSSDSVSGDSEVGGLVGYNNYGTTTYCYSTGSVEGVKSVGGLVGENYKGIIFVSFWDIERSGHTTSDSGTGKTTAEMQDANTFIDSGWGCSSVWTIDDGKDYPRLWWENKPGELITVPSDLYGGGTGEVEDPYLIYTAEQLNKIGLFKCHWDKHFLLCADVDLSGFTGTSFNIIGFDFHNPFSGVFDGNDHTISNLTCDSNDRNHVGMFGYIVGGEIRGLRMIDPNVQAATGDYVGSLVGRLYNGTISNCYVEGGSISASRHVGGLVGYNESGTITNCYSKGNITGEWMIGGLVGSNSGRGKVSNCYSTASVSGDNLVGGLVGMNTSTISNCYSIAGVSGGKKVGGLVGNNSGIVTNCCSTAGVSGGKSVGGLVGDNGGKISNCYSSGSVLGDSEVGVLAGYNYYGRITNCFSKGSVSGDSEVGGLVGRNREGTITNCYSTGSVSCDWRAGGLVGYNKETGEVINSFWDIETSGQDTSDGGTGLPTAEMQMQDTFTDAGWDFVGETVNGIEDIWFIPEGDYPHLWWEGMQVPLKLTPRKLNCRSEGNWVKAHLTLPEGFTVADVASDKPSVLHSFGFLSLPLYVFVNDNELVEIEAAFERQALCSLAGDWPQELTVAGFLADGNIFLGTTAVRISHPGMKVIEDLAWYWLNEDCIHPDFCNDIDMNRDSLVNLLDYALLMNINVEFVTDE